MKEYPIISFEGLFYKLSRIIEKLFIFATLLLLSFFIFRSFANFDSIYLILIAFFAGVTAVLAIILIYICKTHRKVGSFSIIENALFLKYDTNTVKISADEIEYLSFNYDGYFMEFYGYLGYFYFATGTKNYFEIVYKSKEKRKIYILIKNHSEYLNLYDAFLGLKKYTIIQYYNQEKYVKI